MRDGVNASVGFSALGWGRRPERSQLFGGLRWVRGTAAWSNVWSAAFAAIGEYVGLPIGVTVLDLGKNPETALRPTMLSPRLDPAGLPTKFVPAGRGDVAENPWNGLRFAICGNVWTSPRCDGVGGIWSCRRGRTSVCLCDIDFSPGVTTQHSEAALHLPVGVASFVLLQDDDVRWPSGLGGIE